MDFKWLGEILYVEHSSNIYTFATTSRPLTCLEMTRSLTSAWQNSFMTDCWLNSMVIFMKFQFKTVSHSWDVDDRSPDPTGCSERVAFVM